VTYDCPVTSTPFASRARNAEDVVIWRALRSVEDGRAVEVGDHGDASPVGALADHGWAVASLGEAAAVDGLAAGDVHVLAGADDATTVATLAGLSALSLTPWVVVTASGSRASRAAKDPRKPILAAGYVHCLFDGVNNLFVHESHRELADQLSYPACSRDEFTRPADRALADAEHRAADWRAAAVETWTNAAHNQTFSNIAQELVSMQQTVSWRVTKPLRAVRRIVPSAPQ